MVNRTGNSISSDILLAELEKKIAHYVGVRYAVVCSSARSAIRYSLLSLGVGRGDEVIIQDLVPQELPIAVFCTGAKPRLCDVDRQNCAMSYTSFQNALRSNTKAVIFSQLYGLPADPSPIKEVAEKRGVALIEDASQAFGTIANGKKAGSVGDIGILNFNKFLEIPLGAVALTDDEELALKTKLNRNKYEVKSFFVSFFNKVMAFSGLTSRRVVQLIFWGDKYLYKLMNDTLSKKYYTEVDGWINVKSEVLDMWCSNSLTAPVINQILAVADGRYWLRRKMEKMAILLLTKEFECSDEYLQRRRDIASLYEKYLKPCEFATFSVAANCVASYKKYPIIFFKKNRVIKCHRELTKVGFLIDYRYRPLHLSPLFDEMPQHSSFKNSTYLSAHLLPLPVKLDMSRNEIEDVASIVNLSS